MKKELMLSIDIGTQSMRGLIVDTKGNILDFYQVQYEPPYYSIVADSAEQDAPYYYEVLCKITNYLKKNSEGRLDQVIGMVIATFRNSFVCLDKDNIPLRRSILWLDKRLAKDMDSLPFKARLAFGLVGMRKTVDMVRATAHCNYLAHEPKEKKIWHATKHYVSLGCYINYRLTGNLADATANPVGKVPYNYKENRWQKPDELTRCIFDVKDSMMPPLVKTGEVIGTISKEVAKETGLKEGLELIAGGSDKATETLGLGVIYPNQAAISLGTSATIQLASKKYYEPLPHLPAYPAIPPHMYNAEYQIDRGYWLISWFKREFAHKEVEQAKLYNCSAEDLLNKRLKEIPAGCKGLMLQPYWSPLVNNVDAKGAVIGFSDDHNRVYIYRAIIEGLSYALLEGMETMMKRGHQRIDEIRIAGGGSQSDEICQITANVMGLPVKRIQSHEVCGIGAALHGFVSKGIFNSYEEAIKSMVHVKDTFKPEEKEHKIYHKLYKKVYLNIYRSNKVLYSRIKKIVK